MDNNVNEVTRLATGLVLKGDLYSATDIRIDGLVLGGVCSEGKVVVGEKACIKGDVVANYVDVCGNVDGSLYAGDTLSLKSSAKVQGDLWFNRLQIEIGADFVGACKKLSGDEFSSQLKSHRIGDPQSETTEKDEA